jgi:tyrosyl-DNA phosphodiesterase-1
MPKKNTNSYGVFHPKLWILKFDNFIRIVIGSANLSVDDWRIWSNTFWMKDFFLKNFE